MNARCELLQREMNKRFEAVDKRFETMNKRFESLEKRFNFMQWLIAKGFSAVIALMSVFKFIG